MRCKVEGCGWDGYEDTEMCWAHTCGEEPLLPTCVVVEQAPRTFAEEVLDAQRIGDEWAAEWVVEARRREDA